MYNFLLNERLKLLNLNLQIFSFCLEIKCESSGSGIVLLVGNAKHFLNIWHMQSKNLYAKILESCPWTELYLSSSNRISIMKVCFWSESFVGTFPESTKYVFNIKLCLNNYCKAAFDYFNKTMQDVYKFYIQTLDN